MGWGVKGLTYGLPAAGAAQALLGPEEDASGAGKAQQVGRALGGAVFGLTGGVPMLGGMALTGLGTKGLEVAGKGVDVLRGKGKKKSVSFSPEDWNMARYAPPVAGSGPGTSTRGLEQLTRGQG
jgi:hypothetical protein